MGLSSHKQDRRFFGARLCHGGLTSVGCSGILGLTACSTAQVMVPKRLYLNK
jgi:hypothetical protein